MHDSPLEFARIYWLYAGAGLCVLIVALFFVFDHRRETALARLVHSRFRRRLVPGHSPLLRRVKRVLWVSGVLLLCVAAAGPRKGFEEREVQRRGIDILFAIDTSRSMLAEDLAPNRLERARLGIHDFLSRLDGDRVGLIPFAGSSLALCPLTTDYDAFRDSLDALNTDVIPRQGTDVASAIREAERLFSEENNNFRVLVLITDGEDLQGDALTEAESAGKKGTKIYPVGVGSAEGATIPILLENGRKDLVRDDAGNAVITKLDEGTLRKIAELTGGLYAPLGRGAEGLDTVYREKLRLVPKNQTELRTEKVALERFEWLLGAAILLLIMEFLLPDRRRESKPRPLPSIARRHSPTPLLILAGAGWLLTFSAGKVSAEEVKDARLIYNEGTEKYNAGQFEEAAKVLQSGLNTPDLALQNRTYYNLGNALYRVGQEQKKGSPEKTIETWEESMKAYAAALSLDSKDTEARHNLDLVNRKREELKRQEEEKKKKKEKEKEKEQQKKKDEKKDKEDGKKEDQKQDPQSEGDQSGQGKPGDKDGKSGDAGQDPKDGQSGKGKEGQEGGGENHEEKPSGDGGGDQKENPEHKDASGGKSGKTREEDQNSPGTGANQKPDNGKDSKEKEGSQSAGQPESRENSGQKGAGGEKKDDPKGGDKDTPATTGAREKKEDDKGAGGKDKATQAAGGEGKKDEKAEGKDQKAPGVKEGDKQEAPDAKKTGADTADLKSAASKNGEKGKAGQEGGAEKTGSEGEPMSATEERRKPGEMTADEARLLLQTLRSDERTIIPMDAPPRRQGRFRDPNNTTRGKTW